MRDDATPAKVRLTDGLGPALERAEFEAWKRKQGGHYMSRNNEPGSDLTGYQDAHTQGQWEAWQAARAAERERWQARVEQAFREGYWARETYNDSEVSDADEKWASAKAGLLRA